MAPKSAEDTIPKAVWTEDECIALIDGLIAKKSTHQSGNGWKPSVWAGVVALVAAANPDASPKKDQTKCISKINYLKEKFEAYLFVKKYSGIGWDNEDHHATMTEEVMKTFLEVRILLCDCFLCTRLLRRTSPIRCYCQRTTSAAGSTLIRTSSMSAVFDLYQLLMPVFLCRRTAPSTPGASRHPAPTTQN
ncbi:hypothetical protein DFH08DRAFT_833232 [Mycena albidolilacea]|uniref:Myb/SANT-like domain-containing protein n=1 Tax=Mycena albidolilacea TaxID=1033008 RepID=A0AAD7AW59_9AGAR|nr:hypothetical protein DFH08DRAFT_833232 [Mycena albidolilacea]